MKLFAVDGMTLDFDPSNPADTIQGTITILGSPSSKVFAKLSPDKGVYLDGLQVQVSGITVPSVGATIPDPGPYTTTMNKTSDKNEELANNKFILRLDDESDSITAKPKIPASPSPVVYSTTFKIKITDAGQDKVEGN